MMRKPIPLAWVFLLLLGLSVRSAEVVISEFMSANTKTLADDTGEFSDWVELHNPGSVPVNLDNWFLTDESTALTKWRFPATNLPPNGYLVVFASGQDRRKAGLPLHLNFKLSDAGEFLGLVRPDGRTLEHSFSPVYPAQASDVSFGLDTGLRAVSLISSNAVGRWMVPTDGTLGVDWTQPDFADASWRPTTLPLGFAVAAIDAIVPATLQSQLAGYWKLDLASGVEAPDGSPHGNTATTVGFPLNVNPWTNGLSGNALRFRGNSQRAVLRVPRYPKAQGAFSASAWVWADARNSYATVIKNGSTNTGQFHLGLKDTAGDLEVMINTTAGRFTVREGVPLTTGQWHQVSFVADGAALKLFRDGELVGSRSYTGTFVQTSPEPLGIGCRLNDAGAAADTSSVAGVWNGRIDEVALWNRGLEDEEVRLIYDAGIGFRSPFRTDVRGEMFGQSSGAYVRLPFVINSLAELVSWRLSLRYDDGVRAWINGNEVVQRNVPDSLPWNGVASELRPIADSREWELLDLDPYEEYFRPGTNWLAIHLVNAEPHDPDLLLDVTLEAFSSAQTSNQWAYFTIPTPGRENRFGTSGLGPLISEVSHTPQLPRDDQDLWVTARITPTLGPIGRVELRYRGMYSNEVNLAMVDDGLHGDGAKGDQVFGAAIPASAAGPGQMIRYALVAVDASARTNRLPLFTDRVRTEEYFGTVVYNPGITSALPVMQWFVRSPSAAEGDPGTPGSLFYQGEFYDNVRVRIRGGTSRSWPKKSYKVELPEDHEFLIHPDVGRVTEFDWNTTYTDKSYVRATLVSEHQLDVGLPSPEIFPVRLEQNGKFYSVTLFTEQPDAAFLRRHKLDDQGALYKGGPGSNAESDGSFEKKTRKFEDRADIRAFLKGLALKGAALEAFVFDNIDVPAQVNYMATMAAVQDIDGSDKNYFLYRDTEGSGEWRMLPWDLDLSLGPDALNTDNIVFDSPSASHPFIGARPYVLSDGKYNVMLEAIVNTPRARQMLIRRIRTLVDGFLVKPYFQDRMAELYPLMAPDVLLDKAKWKADAHFSGSTYTLLQAMDRIRNEHLTPRVPYLTGTRIPGILTTNVGIQPFAPQLAFGPLEITPASGDPEEEYVQVVNVSDSSVDLSGWKVLGDVSLTFKPGTVLPTGGVVWLSPRVSKFRARATGARGGQGLFVQGDYRGRLSARGGTLRLVNDVGWEIARTNYVGSPSLSQRFLQVTELMNAPTSRSGDLFGSEEYEFIELRNGSSSEVVSLAGVHFTRGITFAFPASPSLLLQPGQRVVVAKNLDAFRARYPQMVGLLAGPYLGSLENGREGIRLEDALGEVIFDFTYHPDWYPITDGHGFSLVLRDGVSATSDLSSSAAWTRSAGYLGSPGDAEPAPPSIPQVRVNEILSAPLGGGSDAIELFNPESFAANLAGWYLTDDFNQPKKYRFPSGSVLAAGGYLDLRQGVFNAQGTGFQLSADGDEVWLFSGDPASGELTGYVHGFAFGAVEAGVTIGRWVDSQSVEHFVAQQRASLGASNSLPRIGPVVVSEIMYHPLATWPGRSEELEFVEIWNPENSAARFDAGAAENTHWTLRGDVDFEFPLDLVLPGQKGLLVVGFDPQVDTAALDSFRLVYGVDVTTPILGPWRGTLGNGSGRISLSRPLPSPATNVVRTEVDLVEYRDTVPWPGADGDGASLQRSSTGAGFANDPASWAAAVPSAGRATPSGVPPFFTLEPVSQTSVAYRDVVFRSSAVGTGPLFYQWFREEEPLPGATNASLQLPSVRPEQFGNYRVTVISPFASRQSSNALLTLRLPASILRQPLSRIVKLGTNVSFTVQAAGSGSLRYQWRFNGNPIPGATGTELALTNVGVADEGDYDVEVLDSVGVVRSSVAHLTVVVPPRIIRQPDTTTVLVGQTLRLYVDAAGTAPFTYRWRRGANTVSGQTNALLQITNVQAGSGGSYSVIVGNSAGSATSETVAVEILADVDRDGMADSWELLNGLQPSVAADAGLDPDGDGVNNRDEYIAGTDPKDAASYLRLDRAELVFVDGLPAVALSWQAVSNRTYSVLGVAEVPRTTQGVSWNERWSQRANPTSGIITITNTLPAAGQEFYRLQTPRLP